MTRNEVFTFSNVLLVCNLLVEISNSPIYMGFLSSHLKRHNQASKELRDVWIFQINIYPINYKSIEHRMKTVYDEFLKFSKTHRYKRKKSWYDKVHCLKIWSRRDYMLKHMTLVKLERQNWNWRHLVSFSLKAKNDIKINDQKEWMKKIYIDITFKVITWWNLLILLILHGQKLLQEKKDL